MMAIRKGAKDSNVEGGSHYTDNMNPSEGGRVHKVAKVGSPDHSAEGPRTNKHGRNKSIGR